LRRWSLGPRERVVLDALEDCDAVVSTGGTYLVDRYWVAGKLFALELGHALGRPVALATQSIGAFRSSSLRARLREALQPCRGVWLRDDRSLRNLSAMGVDRPRIELRPDLAFSLADRDQLRAAGRRRWPTSPRIAVSVRELHPFVGGSGDQAAYETAVRALVIHLVEHHGADVCFLSTCQGVPGYRFDDARVAARIHRTLPAAVAAHCCVDAGYHEPEALPARLADFDLAVATRMHVAILALAAGTPALPIAYEFKTRELFAQLGASDWVSTAQELDAPGLRDRCDAMLQALPRRRAELFERVAIYAERAGATQPWCAALPPRG
jgi:colanic acid/amylovoran biosynthesis protein